MDREFPDVFQMAYAMEEGLRQLYLGLVDRFDDAKIRELLERLASFEEGHKAMLTAMFAPEEFSGSDETGIVEGGLDRQQIMDHFQPQLETMEGVLQLGMMLEAQALDLYTRLARKSEVEKNRELFSFLAKEEGRHLSCLAEKLDTLLAEPVRG